MLIFLSFKLVAIIQGNDPNQGTIGGENWDLIHPHQKPIPNQFFIEGGIVSSIKWQGPSHVMGLTVTFLWTGTLWQRS